MNVGRSNRKTRKIHASDPKNTRNTMCLLPISRRYVRHLNGGEPVNCNDCLKALVDACDYGEFLRRSGVTELFNAREVLTADTITDEQIRELRDSGTLSPGDAWECDIVLRQSIMKRRANKTKARIHTARARCAEIINARSRA